MHGDLPERHIVCLSIDMVGSVAATLAMSSVQRNAFNRAFVRQIAPYLDRLQLSDAVIKFTGDGWLVMKPGDIECARAMLVLAKVMAHRLADDLRHEMGDLASDQIPALRQAICCAYDIEVEVPGKRIDYVGDSARFAVRSSCFCPFNQVIVDHSIYHMIRLDFEVERIDTSVLPPDCKRLEENVPLYRVGDLNSKALKHRDFVPHYVTLLNLTGKAAAADQLVHAQITPVTKSIPSGVSSATDLVGPSDRISNPDAIHEIRRDFRALLRASNPDQAAQIVKAMRGVGQEPDTITFNQHIGRAATEVEALSWFRTMEALGLKPDRYTYNVLMRRGIVP